MQKIIFVKTFEVLDEWWLMQEYYSPETVKAVWNPLFYFLKGKMEFGHEYFSY